MSSEGLTAAATLLSAIAASMSVVITWLVWMGQKKLAVQQQKLQSDIAAQQRVLEGKLADQQQDSQKALAQAERLFSQRSQLLPIWQYISQLNHVNPKKPVTPDVIRVVNALELVAVSCEAEIIDPDVVRRTFRQTYIDLYNEIDQCDDIPGLGKSGRKLLSEHHAAMSLYDSFRQELIAQGQVKSIGG
jgi:hypothetical protein